MKEVFRWKVAWGRPRIRATSRKAEGGEVGRTAYPRNSICRGKYQGGHSKRHAVHGAVPRMCDRGGSEHCGLEHQAEFPRNLVERRGTFVQCLHSTKGPRITSWDQ